MLEVNQPHPHTRRRRGKSDPIDAELAARHALAARPRATPKRHDRDRRVDPPAAGRARRRGEGAQSPRSTQLGGLIVTAPERAARAAQRAQDAHARKATLCATACGPTPTRLRRARASGQGRAASASRDASPTLDDEIAELDRSSSRSSPTPRRAPSALLGVATGHAGHAARHRRPEHRTPAQRSVFAALCGASPIPVAPASTDRHRLNHGGDRQANRALHMIAVCRLRYCPSTRAYAERRTAEGKTKTEIIRCLKRYIAREIYHTLRADLRSLTALDIYRNALRGALDQPRERREPGIPQRADLGHPRRSLGQRLGRRPVARLATVALGRRRDPPSASARGASRPPDG